MPEERLTVSPAKRLLDLAVAVPLAAVALPVGLVVAVLVRVRLGSPVLFRQQRAGRGGDPIDVVKFRTMSDARDEHGELLADDQRLGRFGTALRASSLDELPQLVSILRGDMSLVGPRPLPLAYVDRYSPRQRRRLDAVPGITGWAQVNGRNAIDWDERLELDVWYVENRSFRLDLQILIRTVRVVVTRSGVSAEGHVTMQEFMGSSPPN